MIQPIYTSIREIQRNYKKISKEVNKTDTPTIVMSNNQPQFVIVSLKLFSNLRENSLNKSAETLLELTKWAEEQGIQGPKDLSKHHNKYNWEE